MSRQRAPLPLFPKQRPFDPSLDAVFARQIARVQRGLTARTKVYQAKVSRECHAITTFEAHGTSGGIDNGANGWK